MKRTYKEISLWIFTIFLGGFLLACSAGNTGNVSQAKTLSQIGGQAHSNSLNGGGVELNSFWLLDETNHYAKVYGKIDGNTITVESMPLQPDNTNIQAYYLPNDIMICRFYKSKWYQLPSGNIIDATVAQPIMLRVGANPSDCSGGESYTLTVKFIPSAKSEMSYYTIESVTAQPDSNNNIAITGLPISTDLKSLTPSFKLSDGATAKICTDGDNNNCTPQTSGQSKVDFSKGAVKYVVTAANGESTTTYNVTASLAPYGSDVYIYTLFPNSPSGYNDSYIYQSKFYVSTGKLEQLTPARVDAWGDYNRFPAYTMIYDANTNTIFGANIYQYASFMTEINKFSINGDGTLQSPVRSEQFTSIRQNPNLGKIAVTQKDSATGNQYVLQIYEKSGVDDNIIVYKLDGSGNFKYSSSTDFIHGNKTDIAVTPNISGKPTWVFVTRPWSNAIDTYKLDYNTGTLSLKAGSVNTRGYSPFDIVVDPSGKYLYVRNGGQNGQSGSLAVFAINNDTGDLTFKSAVATPNYYPQAANWAFLPQAPRSIAIATEQIENYLYVNSSSTSNIGIYSINKNDGSLTNRGSFNYSSLSPKLSTSVQSMTVDSSGQYLSFVDLKCNNDLYLLAIDKNNHGALIQAAYKQLDVVDHIGQCYTSDLTVVNVLGGSVVSK